MIGDDKVDIEQIRKAFDRDGAASSKADQDAKSWFKKTAAVKASANSGS